MNLALIKRYEVLSREAAATLSILRDADGSLSFISGDRGALEAAMFAALEATRYGYKSMLLLAVGACTAPPARPWLSPLRGGRNVPFTGSDTLYNVPMLWIGDIEDAARTAWTAEHAQTVARMHRCARRLRRRL